MNTQETISQYSLLYRPRKWGHIFGQDSVVKALRKRILDNDFATATLLQGPFGTGKTTICEIFAAGMQAHDENGNPDWDNPSCQAILKGTFDRDTIRLDGSQLSGKADIVEATRNINMKPMYDRYRIIIIEECDQLSTAGMSSLLKVLETSKPYVKFILLSMEDKGVPPAVKSRCQTYNIRPLGIRDTMMCLKDIMEQTGDWTNEKIPNDFRLKGLSAIASAAQGSMRQAVQYLEKCIVNEAWTEEEISDLLEVMDEVATYKILDGLLVKSKDESLWRKLIWMKTGDETNHFINYALMMLSEAMIYKETEVAAADNTEWRMKSLSSSPNIDKLFYCLSLHPQLTKPYIRTSDILGALASYYQDVDFRPNSIRSPAINEPKKESVKEELKKEPIKEKIKLGTEEIPKFLKPKTNSSGMRVREKRSDISSMEIVF
jgi:DNA polymerase III subunit gamma/tau